MIKGIAGLLILRFPHRPLPGYPPSAAPPGKPKYPPRAGLSREESRRLAAATAAAGRATVGTSGLKKTGSYGFLKVSPFLLTIFETPGRAKQG
jgi:hypothetical protein